MNYAPTCILLSCLFLLSCDSHPSPRAIEPKIDFSTIDLATTGTIRGQVTFEGTPPAPTKIPIASFKDCQSDKGFDDDVLIQNGKVQNAFVFIKSGLEKYAFQTPTEEVILDQRQCLYVPRVIGIQVGQSLMIRSSDPFLHNVHGLPKFSQSFNVGMSHASTEIRRIFSDPEIMVPIRCDVHPWMRAYVGVLPHPYFAVTGADGSFEFKNLPPGNYTLAIWHERLGQDNETIALESKQEGVVNFSFPKK